MQVPDFEPAAVDMERITALDTGASCCFSHDDPKIVPWIGSVRFDI